MAKTAGFVENQPLTQEEIDELIRQLIEYQEDGK